MAAVLVDDVFKAHTVATFGLGANLLRFFAIYPSWAVPIDLYFQRSEREWRLVGLERMPDTAPAPD